VAGSSEHGNQPSGSIKGGEYLAYLSVLLDFQDGLFYIELDKCNKMLLKLAS
jgi:hypothetical protein